LPKAHEERGYWFGFYSNEGAEPPHVHVKKDEDEAKFWLRPQVNLEYNYGFADRDLRWMEEVIHKNYRKIMRKWNEHFRRR
jgi:hypothetical protein